MKTFKGLMFVLLALQSVILFGDGGLLLAEGPKDAAVSDIQEKCKVIDRATSYRKVEVSPSAAAAEGNASDILAGYFEGDELKKITTHAFDDKGVGITECYFDGGKLIFVSWHAPSCEGLQPKEGFGQFYFKDGQLIEWLDAGGKVVNEGAVKTEALYAKREISIKGWADEARKRIEGNEGKDKGNRGEDPGR